MRRLAQLTMLLMLCFYGCSDELDQRQKGSDESLDVVPPIYKYRLTLKDSDYPARLFQVDVLHINKEAVAFLDEIADLPLEKQRQNMKVIVGEIEKVQLSPQHHWHFRIKPETLSFADLTMELCDATISYIEEDIDGWIESVPSGMWCPWTTRKMLAAISKY